MIDWEGWVVNIVDRLKELMVGDISVCELVALTTTTLRDGLGRMGYQ